MRRILLALIVLLIVSPAFGQEDTDCFVCGNKGKCEKSPFHDGFGGTLCEERCSYFSVGGKTVTKCLCSTRNSCPTDVPPGGGGGGEFRQSYPIAGDYRLSSTIFETLPANVADFFSLLPKELVEGSFNGVFTVGLDARSLSSRFTGEVAIAGDEASLNFRFRGPGAPARALSGTFWNAGRSGFVILDSGDTTESFTVGE